MIVSTATPAEIDTRLAALYAQINRAEQEISVAQRTIDAYNEADESERKHYPWLSQERFDAAYKAQCVAIGQREVASAEAVGLEVEFTKRGGWTRFYLVTNGNGHVHWTTACNTCFPTTQFAWLTEQSGMTHDALVEMAGEMACTVCFPNAPVDVLKRKGTLEAPERKAAREEREAKRAAKAAAEVEVEGYIGWRGEPGTKTFKSVRAVTNDIASNLSSLCHYGSSHPSATEWLMNVASCVAALDARGEEYDYDKALATARKRVEKQNRTGRWGDPTWTAKF